MDENPLPNAEKKPRARGGKRPFKEKLLTPKTWRAATAALGFFSKLINVCAKLWDMFE